MQRENKLLTNRPHFFRTPATGLALSACLIVGSTTPLPAGPEISVNGNLVTRSNEARPLKVIHGKAIHLGDDLPALTADLFEPVFLHHNQPLLAKDSFYDSNRQDGLPVKESIPMMVDVDAQNTPAPRELVRLESELPRLDPMIFAGRLTLAQIPNYAASQRAQEKAESIMNSGIFADLEPSRENVADLIASPAEEMLATTSTPSTSNDDPLPAATDTATEDNLDGLAAPSVSLASVAKEKAFLNSAWINYDENGQKFKATWSKPPLFHYGMVLLPELAKRVDVGQEVQFRYRDMPAKLTKDEKGRLFVTAAGEAQLVTAGRLKKLLEEKIETDGMILMLDNSGNLVLHASGQSALVMNEHAGR